MSGKSNTKSSTVKADKKIKKPAAPLQLRQGDVLLTGVDSIPSDAVAVKRGKGAVILQQGSATGHAHQIKARMASLHTKGDARYLRVVEPVDLTHEEHEKVSIPAGDYVVSIHHEYAPGELPRQVYD